MKFGLLNNLILPLVFLASLPASANYQLHNYGYGSGGTANSTSASYNLNATTGEVSNVQSSSATYNSRPGNNNTQQAHVPPAPIFTNPASYYDKLRFIVSPGANPSDTLFSIAISENDFATTRYIQNDNTIGNARGIEDYQTYSAWGGASGQLVVGLTPGTTYKIKVNAFQGRFTETEYGPTATAATVAPSITLDIDVSASDSETAPPYTTSFISLYPATVSDAAEKIWIDIDTNANNGGMVYFKSTNNGLKSNYTGVTIASATADLAVATTGFGVQGSTVAQGSGGPLTITSPYNGAGQNVGLLDTALRQVFSSTAPITAGRGSVVLKAKSAATTPAGSDYEDILTIVIAGSF